MTESLIDKFSMDLWDREDFRLSIRVSGELEAEQLKKQIISEHKIVERLRKRIEIIKSIPKNDEDFIFTHYRMEQEDLEEILGEKK